MRIHALPNPATRMSAGGGAGLTEMIVALLLLAAALGALTAVPRDDSPVAAVGCCVVLAAAVALRRRMPMLTTVAALTALVGYELATHDRNLAVPPVAVVLTCYTFGRWSTSGPQVWRTVMVCGLGLAAMWTISAGLNGTPGKAVSAWLTMVMAPCAAGVVLARRGRLSQRLAETARQLQAEQELSTAQATSAERNRVARDLHDVVAHGVSVMVVQAGAARLVAARSAAEADQALAVIGACGRDAMADLRRIVGVLRRGDDADFGRGAGLGDLAGLIKRIETAGVSTRLHITGTTQLPPPIDVVAYRIVQEALTNVVKHAGAAATADVDVHVGPRAVTVEVTNGTRATSRRFTTSGHGLVGMNERVTAYGGELRVGPRPGGRFGVFARIPFHHEEAPQSGTVLTSRRRPRWRTQPMSSRLTNATIVMFWLAVLEVEVATSPARRGPWLLNAAAVAAMAAAAGWRRRLPLLFLVVIGGLAAGLSSGLTSLEQSTFTGWYTLAVPLFTVAAWEARARATTGLLLWATGASSLAVVHKAEAGGLAGAVVMGIVVWSAGRVWRAQLLLNADLTQTTAQLVGERERRARLAVATERTRIARELHGLVAHGVITMVVQAEAARQLLAHQPGQVEAAIRDIEQTGREALTQLRRILGVLRSTADFPAVVPGAATAPPAPDLDEHPTWLTAAVLT